MPELYERMLEVMDAAFRDFAAAITQPNRVRQGDGWVYRFSTQDVHHAMVLKLALIQSGLRGALVLLRHGHLMEQAILERVIDEASEDVLFLAYAITNDRITPLHEQYLAAFWAED